ncbi:MAG: thiosulfate oxidation carrier protein SoxY [Pseudomonadota bacterium]
MSENSITPFLTRRSVLGMGAGAVLVSSLPIAAYAEQSDLDATIFELFGDRPIEDGNVTLTLPPISENGFSVPLTVDVDSPMTAEDHITQIAVFSPRNPLADIARFKLGARAGRASVSTRIRLAGTQVITAVAETSQGRLLRGQAETVVTLAACVIL